MSVCLPVEVSSNDRQISCLNGNLTTNLIGHIQICVWINATWGARLKCFQHFLWNLLGLVQVQHFPDPRQVKQFKRSFFTLSMAVKEIVVCIGLDCCHCFAYFTTHSVSEGPLCACIPIRESLKYVNGLYYLKLHLQIS